MQQSLQFSLYHSALRVSALTLTLTLLFVSGVVHPITSQLAQQTENYVATAIGASAGVAPTELNQITAALTQQQATLDQREETLRERELALGITNQARTSQWSTEMVTYVNSVLLFIVVSLMAINYVLDWRWRRTPSHSAQGVPS